MHDDCSVSAFAKARSLPIYNSLKKQTDAILKGSELLKSSIFEKFKEFLKAKFTLQA